MGQQSATRHLPLTLYNKLLRRIFLPNNLEMRAKGKRLLNLWHLPLTLYNELLREVFLPNNLETRAKGKLMLNLRHPRGSLQQTISFLLRMISKNRLLHLKTFYQNKLKIQLLVCTRIFSLVIVQLSNLPDRYQKRLKQV